MSITRAAESFYVIKFICSNDVCRPIIVVTMFAEYFNGGGFSDKFLIEVGRLLKSKSWLVVYEKLLYF